MTKISDSHKKISNSKYLFFCLPDGYDGGYDCCIRCSGYARDSGIALRLESGADGGAGVLENLKIKKCIKGEKDQEKITEIYRYSCNFKSNNKNFMEWRG